MSKLKLYYGQQLKQLTVDQCQSPSQFCKLLKSTFRINDQILGVTNSCGKFYDIIYASENIKTLTKHKLNLITSKDAVDIMSFGTKRSVLNQFSRTNIQIGCLGKINDLTKFKEFLPFGLVVILSLNENDQTDNIPFQYYLARDQKRSLQIWNDKIQLIECQIGNNLLSFYIGVKKYITGLKKRNISTEQAVNIMEVQTKQAMILNSFEQLLQQGVISELQFYKKKIMLLQKPHYFINIFFTGQTIDRSELVDQIREYVIKRRQEARILGIVSSQSSKQEIPIFVRKGSNIIQKVSSEHILSIQQEQVLNLFQQLELKGLITQKQMEIYQQHLLKTNDELMRLSGQYFQKQFDQIQLTRRLRKLIRRDKQQKKLIQ